MGIADTRVVSVSVGFLSKLHGKIGKCWRWFG